MKNTMHKMPAIRTLPLLLTTLWSTADAASLTRTVSYSYDAQGELKQEVVEPDNPALRLQTDYIVDGWGNRTSTTVSGQGVTSRTSKTIYDTQGRLPVSTENAKGQQENLTLDPVWGQIKTATDANQLSVSYEYDGLGRKIKSTSVDGIVTSWTYAFCSELAGCSYKLTRHTNGQPDVTDYIDGLGRTLRSSVVGFDGRASLVDTEYDDLGRVKRKSDPYYPGDTPRWTVYEYDALSRVTKETRPDAGYNQYSYNGLDTTLTNAKLQSNVKTVNSQGQLVKVVDAAGKTLRYDYDPFGNVVQTLDSQGNRIALEYDLRGRKTRMSDPDLGAWSYSYNVYGELTSQTDARGNSTTLSYDSLGRLIARTEADFNSAWEYDTASKGIGKLAKATATNGYVREYQYDAYGREQEVRYTIDQPTPYVKQTRYDSLGRVSGYSYPTGVQVDYLYNAQGYAYQLKNSQSGRVYWTANTLSASGKVLQDTLGNGVTTQRQYDELDRLKQTEASLSGDLRFREVYTWDKVGNLLERNSQYANGNLATDRFTYDALNRLTLSSGDAPVSTQEVQYDELGNILYKTAVGSYSYPAPGAARPHAVSSINNGSSIRSFNYDANGNLLNDGQRTLSWTSFNLPATIQGYGQSETYSYDAEHERVKQVSSVWGTQIYINPAAGGGLFYEKTSKDGKTEHHHYLTANGNVVGDYLTRDNPGVGELPAEERYWLKDHLGSNRAVLNASGGLLESLGFDAWGKRRFASGNANGQTDPNLPPNNLIGITTDRGYTGHEHLDELGLIHMNGRIYDPTIARFMSADKEITDTTLLQNFNRYSYVINNPLSLLDPSGWGLVDDENAKWGGVSPHDRYKKETETHDHEYRRVGEGRLPDGTYDAFWESKSTGDVGRLKSLDSKGNVKFNKVPDDAFVNQGMDWFEIAPRRVRAIMLARQVFIEHFKRNPKFSKGVGWEKYKKNKYGGYDFDGYDIAARYVGDITGVPEIELSPKYYRDKYSPDLAEDLLDSVFHEGIHMREPAIKNLYDATLNRKHPDVVEKANQEIQKYLDKFKKDLGDLMRR